MARPVTQQSLQQHEDAQQASVQQVQLLQAPMDLTPLQTQQQQHAFYPVPSALPPPPTNSAAEYPVSPSLQQTFQGMLPPATPASGGPPGGRSRRGIDCPDSLWKDPQPEEVQGLLSVAIELLLGISTQKLRQEEMSGDVKVPTPDSVAALPLPMFVFLHIHVYMGVLGLSDFNRTHVFSPTPQSVLRLGVALCCFLRQREAVQSEAGSLAEALQQTQLAAARAEEDLRHTEQQLQRMTSERDAQHQHAVKLRKEQQALKASVSSLEVELTSAQDKRALQEKQQHRLQQELREAAQELTRLQQQREEFKDQIVHSPNKWQGFDCPMKGRDCVAPCNSRVSLLSHSLELR
ncbi:Nuf2 family domain-containing protein [Cyclospora cayetanensis]|uniref:Nuf2 family domain-containing protein n=1 Tax=Cyclospora cayetanensis TaxID=88456 RepID=A0A1D3CSJ3_9EIME|nr:Nuf2 family domain-containing protein [Cyclospora cayetanensis]